MHLPKIPNAFPAERGKFPGRTTDLSSFQPLAAGAAKIPRFAGNCRPGPSPLVSAPAIPAAESEAMDIRDGFVGTIGNTPLIKLRRASEATGCTILGKAEFLNPGGSVKDRAALFIIKDAEEKGLLRPGGVVVEGTAGNTGIGLALVGNARGYRTVIVMPETQSQEKKDMLLLCGVDLRLVPAVPYSNPDNYVRYSGRLAEEIAAREPNGAIWANQFDNLANRRAHIETTGPEIWAQTDGKIDGFTCSVGTGGTLSGVGIALKERNPAVQIYLSDPMGSGIYSWYARHEFKPEGSSITEGIGNNRETKNLEGFKPDGQFQITDEEALPLLFDLVTEEGLVLGGSTAINIAGAIRLARELGPGKTIVTILADSGTRYQSKLFNPAFLKERNLPVPRWLDK
jgi:cysteine synthase A